MLEVDAAAWGPFSLSTHNSAKLYASNPINDRIPDTYFSASNFQSG